MEDRGYTDRLMTMEEEDTSSKFPDFFTGFPTYKGSIANFIKEIDDAKKKCTKNMVEFINKGGCDSDICMEKAKTMEENCKKRMSEHQSKTLLEQLNQLTKKIQILENEKVKDNITVGELQALKQEKSEVEQELLICTDVGHFNNFPAGFAIFVLIVSFFLFFSTLYVYLNINTPTGNQFGVAFILCGASITGVVISILQICTIFK